MKVAVIIVNFGTAELAIEAVRSVLDRENLGIEVDVHLVDNASPGGDAAVLKAAHVKYGWNERVKLWLEAENHGFGRGNNVVLSSLTDELSVPDFVFFLNPDASLGNEAISILVKALRADELAAVAGAKISFPDGNPAIACFRFPSLFTEVVGTIDLGFLYRLFPFAKVAFEADREAGPVDWVSGASMMVRFSALCEVGFFDPDFFLYFEEVELTHRLASAGYHALYVPSAHIIHEAGASTKTTTASSGGARRPSFVYDSWRLYFTKVYGLRYAIITAFCKLAAAFVNQLVSLLRLKSSTLPKSFYLDHTRYVILPMFRGK